MSTRDTPTTRFPSIAGGRVRLSPTAIGLAYGLLAVASFSISLPATRIAVLELDPMFVGLGRGVLAGILAGFVLFATHQPFPNARRMRSLAVVALGVVVGFPLLSAWAMRRLPASHGAVLLGVLPLLTAIAGALTTGERPSRKFWLASASGSAAVTGFAVYSGAGQFEPADLVLAAGLLLGAVGYAEGGRLAREIGGWQVISWAVFLSAPFLALPMLYYTVTTDLDVSVPAWVGFGYVCLISQYLGFFAWYHGLALGGVSRVAQTQLLQPFMTFVAAWVMLGEQITAPMAVTASIVVLSVFAAARARIQPVPAAACDAAGPVPSEVTA